MKTAIPDAARDTQSPTSSSRAPLLAPHSGHLAQLAVMMNQSPQVQAQLKLRDEIQNSERVQRQIALAAEINHAPVAQPQLKEEEPAQREEAPSPNNTGLPDQLKAGVENLSGISLDDVQVHYNSEKPAQLNALAYAQGTDIHVAPGQEKHLPHEAWHIVQQAQGRVKPTMQMRSSVPVNDDPELEHEADVMGQRALAPLQMREQADLLPSIRNLDISVQRMSLQPIQLQILDNVRVVNNQYSSQPHERRVYRLIVDPDADNRLQKQIERARAFASAGANREERAGLLFQYVDDLPKDETIRNELYTPTGEQDGAGNEIREAFLGECLETASACRERAAFLQLLLAQEGIQTDYTVGAFDRQRHAWLQIGPRDPSVIDPTLTRAGMKLPQYDIGRTVALTEPVHTNAFNFDAMQEAAYNRSVRSGWARTFSRGEPTLREKADASLAEHSRNRDRLVADVLRMIDGNRVLLQLEREGVINREAIANKSVYILTNEVIPNLRGMTSWPLMPGTAI